MTRTQARWDEEILEAIWCFVDQEYQAKAWFGLDPQIVDDPDEAVNTLDDHDIELWLKQREPDIGPEMTKYMKDFIASALGVADYPDRFQAFYSDEWIKLRLKALVLVKMLEYFIATQKKPEQDSVYLKAQKKPEQDSVDPKA